MKPILLLAWLLLPIAGFLYHGGPGQELLVLDRAGVDLREAGELLANGDPIGAELHFRSALTSLPDDKEEERRRVRLQLAQIWMDTERLPAAWLELNALVEEDWSAIEDPDLLDDTRSALAQARYYLTWLMRLEGRPRNEWEPEIDSARQTYRYLAEKAEDRGDESELAENRENLESAIRLARMDLSELQGLSLPSQCRGCCSGDCKGGGKRPGKKNGKGNKETEDARGASSGPPPDKGGS